MSVSIDVSLRRVHEKMRRCVAAEEPDNHADADRLLATTIRILGQGFPPRSEARRMIRGILRFNGQVRKWYS